MPLTLTGHSDAPVDGMPRRYTVYEGSRGEIAAELDRYGLELVAHGRMDLARQAARALADLADEAVSRVRVGHLVYDVADASGA